MVSSSLHAEDHCARLRRQARVYQVRELEGSGWQTLDDIIHQVVSVPEFTELIGNLRTSPTSPVSSDHRAICGDRLFKSDATHGISESLYQSSAPGIPRNCGNPCNRMARGKTEAFKTRPHNRGTPPLGFCHDWQF